MKENILLVLLLISMMTGCTTPNDTTNTNSKEKFTEDDCKKMLGEIMYNSFNDVTGDTSAAMRECKYKLEEKVK